MAAAGRLEQQLVGPVRGRRRAWSPVRPLRAVAAAVRHRLARGSPGASSSSSAVVGGGGRRSGSTPRSGGSRRAARRCQVQPGIPLSRTGVSMTADSAYRGRGCGDERDPAVARSRTRRPDARRDQRPAAEQAHRVELGAGAQASRLEARTGSGTPGRPASSTRYRSAGTACSPPAAGSACGTTAIVVRDERPAAGRAVAAATPASSRSAASIAPDHGVRAGRRAGRARSRGRRSSDGDRRPGRRRAAAASAVRRSRTRAAGSTAGGGCPASAGPIAPNVGCGTGATAVRARAARPSGGGRAASRAGRLPGPRARTAPPPGPGRDRRAASNRTPAGHATWSGGPPSRRSNTSRPPGSSVPTRR